MIQDFISKIKARVIIVFLIVHLGLIMGVYALARYSALNTWDQTSVFFLAGILCVYMGFFLGVFFIVWPILPWVKRVQAAEHWTKRWMDELPTLIENLPKIIAIVQSIRAAWKEPAEKSVEKSAEKL
jgi:hypothetical protein